MVLATWRIRERGQEQTDKGVKTSCHHMVLHVCESGLCRLPSGCVDRMRMKY